VGCSGEDDGTNHPRCRGSALAWTCSFALSGKLIKIFKTAHHPRLSKPLPPKNHVTEEKNLLYDADYAAYFGFLNTSDAFDNGTVPRSIIVQINPCGRRRRRQASRLILHGGVFRYRSTKVEIFMKSAKSKLLRKSSEACKSLMHLNLRKSVPGQKRDKIGRNASEIR